MEFIANIFLHLEKSFNSFPYNLNRRVFIGETASNAVAALIRN